MEWNRNTAIKECVKNTVIRPFHDWRRHDTVIVLLSERKGREVAKIQVSTDRQCDWHSRQGRGSHRRGQKEANIMLTNQSDKSSVAKNDKRHNRARKKQ